MKSWHELQKEVAVWGLHNFGQQRAWQPMLGLVEEVGEFAAARDQGNHAAMEDALADQAIYVLNLCEIAGLSMAHIADTNDATNYTDRQMLGVLGLCCHAVLKHEQGIRGMDDHIRADRLFTSLSVWFRWAAFQCLEHNIDIDPMRHITNRVWEQVRLRDWAKNRTDAHKVRDDLAGGK